MDRVRWWGNGSQWFSARVEVGADHYCRGFLGTAPECAGSSSIHLRRNSIFVNIDVCRIKGRMGMSVRWRRWSPSH